MNATDNEPRSGFDDHLGLCPECLAVGDLAQEHLYYLNIKKIHYNVCEKHGVYWKFGSNLFSGWCYESEETWQRNANKLEKMRAIEPGFLPETVAAQRERKAAECSIIELWSFLTPEQKELVTKLLCELTRLDVSEFGVHSRRREPTKFEVVRFRNGGHGSDS
jgi:hypothetical protein